MMMSARPFGWLKCVFVFFSTPFPILSFLPPSV